jgi:hypothetical protein
MIMIEWMSVRLGICLSAVVSAHEKAAEKDRGTGQIEFWA